MAYNKVYEAISKLLTPDTGPIPPPTPRPEYDHNAEPPKWDVKRLISGYEAPEVHPDTPRRRGGLPSSDDKPDWRGVIKNNVIPLEAAKAYDFGQPEDPKYYWFDTPDYADPFKKLWSSFKILVKTGVLASYGVACFQGMPFNWASHRHLIRFWLGPWVLGGMTASAAIITVSNLRGEKDDLWNYVAGGFAAGAVTGRNHYIKHMNHTVVWIATAVFVKYANEQNMVILTRINERSRNLGIHGNSAEDGIMSGNFHLLKGNRGDPGRDVRRHPL